MAVVSNGMRHAWGAAALTVLACCAASPTIALADLPPLERIEPRLLSLCQEREMKALDACGAGLFQFDHDLCARGRVRVQVDTGPDGPVGEDLRTRLCGPLRSLEWEGAIGHWAQVVVDIDELPALAATPDIFYVLRPPGPIALVESQALPEIGATDYLRAGHDGGSIRVGVIDLGFARATDLIGSELPGDTRMRAFYGSPSGNGNINGDGSVHGTACAEIVHDVAPGARLYLANANSATELDAAVRWMVAQGVEVISHSIGWFFGPGDGTGPLSDIAGWAIDQEVLWVNAAGNQAQAYWEGDFTDTDQDGQHEFSLSGDSSITCDDGHGSRRFLLVLTWNRWPYSPDLAFDIEVEENGALASTSATDFWGFPYAYRDLDFSRTRPGTRVDISIRRTRGTAPAHLRLMRIDGDPLEEHNVARGSLVLPADHPRVLSVGAYRVGEGFLERFSSLGPNQAGVAKPEICGPDFVSTSATGSESFLGTSAACPHVAGAAALLLACSPDAGFFDFRWTGEETRRLLAASAERMTGADSIGSLWGRLRLPAGADRERSPAIIDLALPIQGAPPYRWIVPFPACGAVTACLYEASGRRIAELAPFRDSSAGRVIVRWDGRDRAGLRSQNGPLLLVVSGPDRTARSRILVVR